MKANSQKFGQHRLTSLFLAVFASILVTIILYAYRNTEIQIRLENLLYDFRVRVTPQIEKSDSVAVITVSDNTIKTLDGAEAKTLSVSSLHKIIEATLKSGATSIGVLLPHQDFDYDAKEMWPLIKLAQKHPNLYFGIFDENRKDVLEHKSSLLLAQASSSVYAADTNREYRRSIVRYEILQSLFGRSQRMHLVTKMAYDILPEEKRKSLNQLIASSQKKFEQEITNSDKSITQQVTPANFLVNFKSPSSFSTIEGESLLQKFNPESLRNKTVLIGYTAFRKRHGAFQDGTYVNTPWQSETTKISPQSSMPLVFVHASALDNLINSNWFSKASPYVNLLQIILVGLASFLVWRLSKTAAVLLYLAIFIVTISLQTILMSWFHYLIPLGDTVLISLFAAIGGAFTHAQKESKTRAKLEAKSRGDREVAEIQSKFLDRFSSELYLLNESVLSLIKDLKKNDSDTKTITQAKLRAVSSCEELQEYLGSIKQLTSLDRIKKGQAPKQKISLQEMTHRLIQQFDRICQEKSIQVRTEGIDTKQEIWSSPWFLESILFNLISNAIKYSPDHEVVWIKISPSKKNKLKIEIIDHGPGVPIKYKQRIFEKFYRIKNDSVFKIKGSGLGLYLSRFFAQCIGTEIKLDTDSKNGSSFSLTVDCFQSKNTNKNFLRRAE